MDWNKYLVRLQKSMQEHGPFNKYCLIYKFTKVKVTQSCLTLCDSMDCSLPGSSVHGISQASIPEWVAISFSRGFSEPRDQTQVFCILGWFFTAWAIREAWILKNKCCLVLTVTYKLRTYFQLILWLISWLLYTWIMIQLLCGDRISQIKFSNGWRRDNIFMGTRKHGIERKSEKLHEVRNKDDLRHGLYLQWVQSLDGKAKWTHNSTGILH